MSFRSVFIALVIGFGLVLAGFLVNRQRPAIETSQPSPDLVRATGKCAECHTTRHYSIVHEYELSAHAAKGVNCLECHQPAQNQGSVDHHGFTIATQVTAAPMQRRIRTEGLLRGLMAVLPAKGRSGTQGCRPFPAPCTRGRARRCSCAGTTSRPCRGS